MNIVQNFAKIKDWQDLDLVREHDINIENYRPHRLNKVLQSFLISLLNTVQFNRIANQF
jgi:hypothetical protein